MTCQFYGPCPLPATAECMLCGALVCARHGTTEYHPYVRPLPAEGQA